MVSQSSCPSIGILMGGRGGWNNCAHIFAIPILQSLNSNTQTPDRLNTTTLRAAPTFRVAACMCWAPRWAARGVVNIFISRAHFLKISRCLLSVKYHIGCKERYFLLSLHFGKTNSEPTDEQLLFCFIGSIESGKVKVFLKRGRDRGWPFSQCKQRLSCKQ